MVSTVDKNYKGGFVAASEKQGIMQGLSMVGSVKGYDSLGKNADAMLQNQAQLGVESSAHQAAGTIRGAGSIDNAAILAGKQAQVQTSISSQMMNRFKVGGLITAGFNSQAASTQGVLNSVGKLGSSKYIESQAYQAEKKAVEASVSLEQDLLAGLAEKEKGKAAHVSDFGKEKMSISAALEAGKAQQQTLMYGRQDGMDKTAIEAISRGKDLKHREEIAKDMLAKGAILAMPKFNDQGRVVGNTVVSTLGAEAAMAYGRGMGDKITDGMQSAIFGGAAFKLASGSVSMSQDNSSASTDKRSQTTGVEKTGQLSKHASEGMQKAGMSQDAAETTIHGSQEAKEVAGVASTASQYTGIWQAASAQSFLSRNGKGLTKMPISAPTTNIASAIQPSVISTSSNLNSSLGMADAATSGTRSILSHATEFGKGIMKGGLVGLATEGVARVEDYVVGSQLEEGNVRSAAGSAIIANALHATGNAVGATVTLAAGGLAKGVGYVTGSQTISGFGDRTVDMANGMAADTYNRAGYAISNIREVVTGNGVSGYQPQHPVANGTTTQPLRPEAQKMIMQTESTNDLTKNLQSEFSQFKSGQDMNQWEQEKIQKEQNEKLDSLQQALDKYKKDKR